ncbi:MAG: nucleoside triphosphate pyrophosphohydrolase [Deferribacteraceae bacterium]|nr:nucleoside triphosphate pyrophosphohydrolase [Deferribacteraceae bacterium]
MKKSFKDLLEAVSALRAPDGCPWDRKQTLYSLKDDLVEETYELVSAIDKNDIPNICEELGDVLLHVTLHAQIASEANLFNIDDVIDNITEKIIRRHPHVFANEQIADVGEVLKRWEEIKREEKGEQVAHYLDKANKGLPTLPKAAKLQAAAAKVGFDWKEPEDIFDKVDEELAELKLAAQEGDISHIKEELGDLLFVIANLARRYGLSADEALRGTNEKFVKRFNFIEDSLKDSGKELESASIDEMEALWIKAKR